MEAASGLMNLVMLRRWAAVRYLLSVKSVSAPGAANHSGSAIDAAERRAPGRHDLRRFDSDATGSAGFVGRIGGCYIRNCLEDLPLAVTGLLQ